MLPYSPLHHLLLADAGDDARDDERQRLRRADRLSTTRTRASGSPRSPTCSCVHDRPIETRTDDSVVRGRADGRPLLLRRSRGYVPDAARRCRSTAARHLLACGAELKNTFAVAKGGARLGRAPRRRPQELRDAPLVHGGHRPLPAAVRGRARGRRARPAPRVPVDEARAASSTASRLIGVQHHHAHLAACLAEHGETGPAVGAIFDGTATATDGTVWGGELLFGDLEGFERVGLLFPVRMPGGDAAVRQPWRMACAWLAAALDEPPRCRGRCAGRSSADAWRQVAELARSGVASPLTTSVGPAVRRGRRALRRPRRGQLRGPGRGRARGGVRPGRARRLPAPARDDGGGPLVMDARATVRALRRRPRRRRRRRDGRGPLPQRARRRPPPRACERRGRAPRHRHRRALRRRVPEPAPARADGGAARRARAAGARARSGCRRTTAASPTGSWPSPRPAGAEDGGAMFGLDEWLAELAHGEALVGGAGGRAAARPAPRLRPRPPGRGLDADRLRARGRRRGARAARARLGARPRARRSRCSACRSCSSTPTCPTPVAARAPRRWSG